MVLRWRGLLFCALAGMVIARSAAALDEGGGEIPPLTKLLGACCDRCFGACTLVNSSGECSGAFFAGAACEPDPCAAVADCCLPDGSCIITTIGACITAGGGGFTGEPCSPASCMGSCCTFDGQCSITPSGSCLGFFQLLGGCEPPVCGGACCVLDSLCILAASPDLCPGNFVLGGACLPNPCEPCPVACCRADGTCIITLPAVCFDTTGGEILAQPVCSPSACDGACCLADGTCIKTLRNDCDLSDPIRLWNGAGSTCALAACAGACCRVDFSCLVTGENSCLFPSHYLGGGAVCDPGICNPPTFACCQVDLACVLSTECDCVSRGGAFYLGTACAAVSCAENNQIGACCFGGKPESCMVTTTDGCNGNFAPGLTCADSFCNFEPMFACCCYDTCLLTNPNQCMGVSYFNVTTCSPNPCAAGACCDPLSALCVALPYPSLCSGTYAAGQSCEPNPCPPPPVGACCDHDTDECSILTFLQCAQGGGGYYRGDNVTCTPTLCGGACCLPPIYGGVGSVCQILTRPDCAQAGGTHTGVFSSCGYLSNLTTCCRANFNGFGGVSVQDLFDFLHAFFNDEPRADFNSSGVVSVQDLFDFLAAFFAGCA